MQRSQSSEIFFKDLQRRKENVIYWQEFHVVNKKLNVIYKEKYFF